MEFWERVKEVIREKNTTQEWVADKASISFNTFRGWITKQIDPRIEDAAAIADALEVSLDLLTGREFLAPSGKIVNDTNFDAAGLIPQKVSAGFGQQLLDFAPTDLVQQAPYPKKWGKGLYAVEVMGDSMTGVNLFHGDLVYFKPGEILGDGLYVLQVNGDMLVKRLEFDSLNRKITIISENPRYAPRTEARDSQAITVLGKVRGWLHEHPY